MTSEGANHQSFKLKETVDSLPINGNKKSALWHSVHCFCLGMFAETSTNAVLSAVVILVAFS